MQKWQYLQLEYQISGKEMWKNGSKWEDPDCMMSINDRLNQLGEKGWELVSEYLIEYYDEWAETTRKKIIFALKRPTP